MESKEHGTCVTALQQKKESISLIQKQVNYGNFLEDIIVLMVPC